MGLIDNIKKNAIQTGTKIQTSESAQLEKILNKMFYLEKDIDEEVKFVRQVMTRGLESQERVGLHASAIIESENKFCLRQQVLSLLYKQLQGEQVPIGLKGYSKKAMPSTKSGSACLSVPVIPRQRWPTERDLTMNTN